MHLWPPANRCDLTSQKEEVMRKPILIAAAGLFAFNSATMAHDPADFLAPVWQWPAGAVPVLDADMSEYDIVPAEFWLLPGDLIQNYDTEDAAVFQGETADPSSWDMRFLMSWNDESNRIYFAIDEFDDYEMDNPQDNIELGIDADHSGGSFWAEEGTEEENNRTRGRHAQPHHWAFSEGCGETYRGVYGWTWLWVSPADWYGTPRYTDHALEYTQGSPCSLAETRKVVEWYQVYWDDFNWTDPDAPLHDFEVGEIIGMHPRFKDFDSNEDPPPAGTTGRWVLSAQGAVFGDADFYADFQLLDVASDFPTAVVEDSWGRIKASVAR